MSCPALSILGGVELYPGLENKAAMIFYLIIKNHPFQNGNKRLAIFAMQWFLYKNNAFVYTSPEAMYELAVDLAASDPDDKTSVLDELIEFIRKNIDSKDALR